MLLAPDVAVPADAAGCLIPVICQKRKRPARFYNRQTNLIVQAHSCPADTRSSIVAEQTSPFQRYRSSSARARGDRRDNVGLVLREGVYLTVWGIGIGLALAFLVGQLLSSLLYKVSSTDPVVFVGASVVLALISLLACYLPARRAAMVETMVALRYE